IFQPDRQNLLFLAPTETFQLGRLCEASARMSPGAPGSQSGGSTGRAAMRQLRLFLGPDNEARNSRRPFCFPDRCACLSCNPRALLPTVRRRNKIFFWPKKSKALFGVSSRELPSGVSPLSDHPRLDGSSESRSRWQLRLFSIAGSHGEILR